MRHSRRSFLLGTTGLAAVLPALAALQKKYTVQEIMDIIIREVPGGAIANTVDTLKAGKPGMTVTGIVTTMFATINVIKQAIEKKSNFIITHEPVFYNHTDDIEWVPGSKMVQEKLDLLNNNNIAVWRCHDYWHSVIPDGINYGFLKKTGWIKFDPQVNTVFEREAVSLDQIINELKSSLNISYVRVIGNTSQVCRKIAILPGAHGGQRQMELVEKYSPDVLIVGEVHEWETAEYIRDKQQSGKNIALIVIGHAVSEEPGMEWMAEWLAVKITSLPIQYISSGDPFTI